MRRPPRIAELVLLFALATPAACGGDSGSAPPDAAAAAFDAGVPDASTPAVDGGAPDAAPTGHPGAALVPAGAASRSEHYRFVGTLSSGSQAASPGHGIKTGVAGATQ